MPAGRPTTYDPAYCVTVVELGKAGKSEAQIARDLDVPRASLWDWAQAHDEFSAALTQAKDLSQAWWEDAAQEGKANEIIGPAIWKHTMNCRFRADYGDRLAVGGDKGMDPIQTEDVTPHEKLAAFLNGRSEKSR